MCCGWWRVVIITCYFSYKNMLWLSYQGIDGNPYVEPWVHVTAYKLLFLSKGKYCWCAPLSLIFAEFCFYRNYGVESVPKITGLRGPPVFPRSPTFSRPRGFRVLDIPHVNALSVPKIRCLRGSPTFQRSHSLRRPHSFGRPHIDLFLFLRLIGSLMYN